jgi:predicted signal transduction protein with EAL and GGDEF domain
VSLTEDDKQWIREQMDSLTDHMIERMREMQTEILRAFEAWSGEQTIRLRKLEADHSNLDAASSGRIEAVEQRLFEIEKAAAHRTAETAMRTLRLSGDEYSMLIPALSIDLPAATRQEDTEAVIALQQKLLNTPPGRKPDSSEPRPITTAGFMGVLNPDTVEWTYRPTIRQRLQSWFMGGRKPR